MRSLKSVVIVIGALVPVIYCGSLLYYFLDLTGSVEEARTNGLGPTLLGLGLIGLLFCVALVIKVVRMFGGSRPRSGGGPGAPTLDDDGGLDADAVIARYMARQSASLAFSTPASPRPEGHAPARHTGFGRKNR